ncbi:MAG: hypothetical protein HDS26_00285 [Bacteroides sp.]|nr:hypothetical protein [Bacteroides sp.]
MKNILFAIITGATSLISYASANNNVDLNTPFNQNRRIETKGDSLREKYSDNPTIQRIVNETKVVIATGRDSSHPVPEDSIRSLIAQFYDNQFRHSQDPSLPYFMFMSKDAKMALGIGGALKLRTWFDWDGAVGNGGFSPYNIEVPKNPATPRELGANMSGTTIFLTLLGQHSSLGNYMGYIQGDFAGYNKRGFRLKKAYLTLNDWTVGLATSTFTDPAAEPIVVDGAGVNGKMDRTNVLIRYTKSLRRWTIGASIEFPSSKIRTNQWTASSSDWLPDFVVMGQYAWNSGLSHVRLAVLSRALSYRDLVRQKNHTLEGWGVQLSGLVATPSPVTLFFISSIGQGHQSYSGDLSAGSYDLVPDPSQEGKLYAPTAFSIIGGIKYRFSSKVYADMAFSEMRYKPQHTPDPTDYKYGVMGVVNVFWNLTPRLIIGGEYLIGKRMNFNKEHSTSNRIDALFQLNF